MGISGLPGQWRAVACIAVSLVTVAAGAVTPTLVAAPADGADPAGAPLLRLEPDPGSVVSALEAPLGASSWRRPTEAGPATTERLTTTTYSLVGLTWRGPDPHVAVRSRTDGGWGEWHALAVLTDGPDPTGAEGGPGLRGTEPLWVGPSDGVQVRLPGQRPRDLMLVLIDPGSDPGDRTTTAHRPLAARADGEVAPRPALRSRRDWDADPSWRNSPPRYNKRLKQVHVHHTATGNDYRRRDVPGLIRGMYRYHTHNLGWSDIGYNFLVDRFGRSWVGRAGGAGRRVRGAHTLGFNNSSTGVSVIGNFEDATPRDAVISAIVRIAAWKLERNDREPSGTVRVRSHGSDLYPDGERVRLPVIDGHRDTNQTACPGQDLYDLLPRIRKHTQRRVDRS